MTSSIKVITKLYDLIYHLVNTQLNYTTKDNYIILEKVHYGSDI